MWSVKIWCFGNLGNFKATKLRNSFKNSIYHIHQILLHNRCYIMFHLGPLCWTLLYENTNRESPWTCTNKNNSDKTAIQRLMFTLWIHNRSCLLAVNCLVWSYLQNMRIPVRRIPRDIPVKLVTSCQQFVPKFLQLKRKRANTTWQTCYTRLVHV